MNVLKYAALTALVAFAAGFWAGCTVDLSAGENETWSCSSIDDCIDGYECVNGLCRQYTNVPGTTTCVDADGDGFGANESDEERLDCDRCENPDPVCEAAGNCCARDCNDNDMSIRPNAPEACDGFDNDCDGTVDEPTSCTSTGDCPQPSSANLIPSCINPNTSAACAGGTDCVCQVGVSNQLMFPDPTCKDLQCVGGEIEVPAMCGG